MNNSRSRNNNYYDNNSNNDKNNNNKNDDENISRSSFHSNTVGDTVDITVVIGNTMEKFPATIEGINGDGTYTVRYMNGQLGYNIGANNVKFVSSDDRVGRKGERVECVVSINDDIHRFPAIILSVNSDGTYELEYGNGSIGHSINHSDVSFPDRKTNVMMKDDRSLKIPSFSASPSRSVSPREVRNSREGNPSNMSKNQRPGIEKSRKHVQFSNISEFQRYDNDNHYDYDKKNRDNGNSYKSDNYNYYGDISKVNRNRTTKSGISDNLSEVYGVIDSIRNISTAGKDDNADKLLKALVSSAMVTEAAVKASAEASAATAEAIRASSVVSNAISSLIPQRRQEGNHSVTATDGSSILVAPRLNIVGWKCQGNRNHKGSRSVPDDVRSISSGDEVTVEVVYKVNQVNEDGSFELMYGNNQGWISNAQFQLNGNKDSIDPQ